MATGYDTARSTYENYRYCCDNGHTEWVQKAALCFRFWRGGKYQWNDKDLAELTRKGRPALTLDKIGALMRAVKGIQRALRNDVRFAPVMDATYQDAQIRDQLWLSIQNLNTLDFIESEVYERGMITGRAFYDVRVDFDHQLRGDVVITRKRSQDVVLDPSFDEYDSKEWPQVTTRTWTNLLDIEHMWGKAAAEEIKHRTLPDWYSYEDQIMGSSLGRQPYYQGGAPDDDKLRRGYLVLSRQHQQLKYKDVFVDTRTGDTSEIPSNWDRNRVSEILQKVDGVSTMRRKVKCIRWDVTCDQTTLHSDDSPYRNYTIVGFFPELVDGVDKGLVESLIDPQQLYNKVTSQELHIINTTANSGYKLKAGSLKNMTAEEMERRGAENGVVFVLDDPAHLERLAPNPVPQGHDRISFKADQIMNSISGVAPQARGFAREDVAGEAIDLNQAASDVNFASALSNLHRSKQILAGRAMDLATDYYSEERAILFNTGSIYRPQDGQVTINQMTPEGTVLNDITRGKYTTTLIPSPTRSSMTEAEFKEMVMLREKLGIQIPDTLMIELSNAPNKAQLIQQISGDSNEAARRQQQIEEQTALTELEHTKAKVAKEQSAASLNQARAEKFAVEARVDPDAAYERVEANRIDVEKQMHDDKMELEYTKLDHDKQQAARDTALELAKLDHDSDESARDRAHQSGESAKQKAHDSEEAERQMEHQAKEGDKSRVLELKKLSSKPAAGAKRKSK